MIFDRSKAIFPWVVFALVFGAALNFVPLWAPLVLAAWVAGMARPLMNRVARALGGRSRAAGLLVVALVLLMILPVAVAAVSLVRGATDLASGVLKSETAQGALVELAAGGKGPDLDLLKSPQKIMALIQEHGRDAASLLGGLFGVAARVGLGLFLFVYAVYVFLVDGPEQYRWAAEHAPIEAAKLERLRAAFHETGRGLFVGIGLTGLAQGVVATTTYVALGVPRALVLGLITCVASLIPSVGTALVWIPVTAGLALTGRTGAAIVMGLVGVGAISTIDNLMRPVFARFGKLDLSTFILLTSIFGGLSMFGPWGLLAGPLFARLAKEGLKIARAEA